MYSPVVTQTACLGQTYTANGPNSSQPELHVLSAYEPANSTIAVHIERTTQMTVLLSSYEPVNWVLTVEPGVTIDKVLVNGYHSQNISLPNGIPYEIEAMIKQEQTLVVLAATRFPTMVGAAIPIILLQGVQITLASAGQALQDATPHQVLASVKHPFRYSLMNHRVNFGLVVFCLNVDLVENRS